MRGGDRRCSPNSVPSAKVLAGGQSLIPVLAMRLAEPAHLVDINRIGALDTVVATAARA